MPNRVRRLMHIFCLVLQAVKGELLAIQEQMHSQEETLGAKVAELEAKIVAGEEEKAAEAAAAAAAAAEAAQAAAEAEAAA